MTPPQIKVVAVTPVYNRRELTLQCLRSLKRLNLHNIRLEVIIVDDASSDGTVAAVREMFPDVRVIEGDGSLWYSEGTNVGIRKALDDGADFVWQINDDQVFDADALTTMVETAQTHPKSVIGSALLLWDQPHKVFQVAPVWDTWSGGWRHWFKQTVWTLPPGPFEVDLIVGNSMLVPAEAYRRAGLIDSKTFPMVGDGEFSPRLKRCGFKLMVDPRSRVFCQPNTLPPSVSLMPFWKRFGALFGASTQPHNLRRRFHMLIRTAPSPILGLLAFGMFLLRAAIGRSYEGEWGLQAAEPPLAEMFMPAE